MTNAEYDTVRILASEQVAAPSTSKQGEVITIRQSSARVENVKDDDFRSRVHQAAIARMMCHGEFELDFGGAGVVAIFVSNRLA
jgi:hypothetical protein